MIAATKRTRQDELEHSRGYKDILHVLGDFHTVMAAYSLKELMARRAHWRTVPAFGSSKNGDPEVSEIPDNEAWESFEPISSYLIKEMMRGSGAPMAYNVRVYGTILRSMGTLIENIHDYCVKRRLEMGPLAPICFKMEIVDDLDSYLEPTRKFVKTMEF